MARKSKPVVVSMGHLAASGGYWISTYADRIFAEPNSITGSIGVYGMLPKRAEAGQTASGSPGTACRLPSWPT